MAKYKPGENSLTNNFHANMGILFFGLIFVVIASFFDMFEISFNFSNISDIKENALVNFLVFVLAYFFSSYWFSPDLDIHNNRPGKGSFPLKAVLKSIDKTKKKMPVLKPLCYMAYLLLSPIHYVFNFAWRWFWHPFGNAFTHRGLIHWPIIGTQIKLLYVLCSYWLSVHYFSEVANIRHLPFNPSQSFYDFLFGSSGFYKSLLSQKLLLTAVIGMSIADICHIAIDYYDMVKNGNKNFIPPEFVAPRGFFIQFFRFLKKRILGGK